MAPDHADRLLDHLLPARGCRRRRCRGAGAPTRRCRSARPATAAPRPGGRRAGPCRSTITGVPDLGHQLGAEQLLLADDGVLELAQAPLAEGPVGRPPRLVEGPAGGGDGPVHVGGRGVGRLAEHLLGRRVDVVEAAAVARRRPAARRSAFGTRRSAWWRACGGSCSCGSGLSGVGNGVCGAGRRGPRRARTSGPVDSGNGHEPSPRPPHSSSSPGAAPSWGEYGMPPIRRQDRPDCTTTGVG